MLLPLLGPPWSPGRAPERCRPRMVREDVALPPHISAELSSDLRLGSVEEVDIPACVDVLMECFYKDALTLASEQFSAEELEKLTPSLSLFNGALETAARLSLLWDTKRRIGPRLTAGGVARSDTAALLLALQNRTSGEIVGLAELSIQPLDGRVPGDFSIPRLPWAPPVPRCAYICNLGTPTAWRNRGCA